MSIAGTRIKQARHRAKWSQRDLAAEVNVSPTTISKYERSESKPGSEVLMQIADALDVDVSFFLRPQRVGNIEPAYRKLSSLNKGDKRQLTERIRDWLERYLVAEEIVEPEPASFEMPDGFPQLISPTYEVKSEVPLEPMTQVEQISVRLRNSWDLGTDPIGNLTSVLEKHGIRVGHVETNNGFGACTFWAEINGDVPVFVTGEGIPGDRQRHSLAHELGHLILDVDEEVNIEDACDRFAGGLLAPEATIREAVGKTRRKIMIDELHVLKHRFGISMRVLLNRLHNLGIISNTVVEDVRRDLRKHGEHEEEPGEPVESEQTERFRMLVLRALAENLIGEKRARELHGGPIADLESTVWPTA